MRRQPRRVVQRRDVEAVVAAGARGGVGRVGEPPLALTEHRGVERDQPLAHRDVVFDVEEVAVARAGQLVRRAVLMDEPHDLVRVTHEVGRKLRRDHEVDRPPVALAEIEQPPRRGVRENLLLGIPLEGNADELGVVPGVTQLADQLTNVKLGPALHEGHLRFAHENRPDHSRDRRFAGPHPITCHVA